MNNKLEIAQNNFISGIGRMSSAFGLNRFLVQMYALLYLKDRPLSLDEIAQALGASKGNVSINIRELEKWGAVKNVWVKGSRRDFYKAEDAIKEVFLNKIKSSIQKRAVELSILIDEFERTLELMNNESDTEEARLVATYTQRLKKIKEIKDTVASLIEILSNLM